MAQRMRESIETSQIQVGQKPVGVTATFGVTELAVGEPLDEALNRADLALYQGKREGRNRVVVQEPSLTADAATAEQRKQESA